MDNNAKSSAAEMEKLLDEALACYVATWDEDEPIEVREKAKGIRYYVHTLKRDHDQYKEDAEKMAKALQGIGKNSQDCQENHLYLASEALSSLHFKYPSHS